jgi:acyl dehydratase
MRTFSSLDEMAAAVGSHLGYSEWLDITQERIDAFADATDDHQWIHVDPERAAAGPFGVTIAHGYLTLSLGVKFMSEIVAIEGVRMGINYGSNRVRFISPVPVGSRLRAGASLQSFEAVPGGGQATYQLTFEVAGSEKPACVAEVISRFYQ